MSQNHRDEQLPEGSADAHDVCGGSEDDNVLTAFQEKTRSKPRRYRRLFKKMAAAAVRSAGEEFLASWLAKDRGKDGGFYTSRIPKQAIYGSLIHIPITNWLLKGARYLFRGRTSPTSRFLAILFGLLVVAPVQKIIFLAAGAIIAGARTWQQIRATVRVGFLPVMKVVLLAFPIAVAFASDFLPERAWPKFFDIVNLAINIYSNARIKKKRLAALRRRHFGDRVVEKEEWNKSDAGSIAMPTTLRPTYPPIPRGNPVVGQGDVMLDAAQFVMTTPIRPIYPPNPPSDSVVGQADVVLSAGQIVLPAPLRPYRGPSYSSDSAAEEEAESDASPIIMPSPFLPYHRPNYSCNSVAEEEETEPGTVPIRTPSPYQLYYRPNRSSGSVAEGEGAGSDTGQPGAAAAAAEAVTARPLYSADTWQTLDIRNNSSDSDREEKGRGSEIDSDTSSDLPARPRLHRRRRIRW